MPIPPTIEPPPADFQTSDFLSLGVEVEVQLLNGRTLDLVPAAPYLLKRLADDGIFRPEFYSTMLEMVTGVCTNLEQVESELSSAGARLLHAADGVGVRVAGNGTHAFSGLGQPSMLFPNPRYRELMRRNQWIALNKNLFGLHVHVGMSSGEQAIRLMNAATPYLSYLLALSASSPFWHGRDSGLATARTTVFESQPISGPAPPLHSFADYQSLTRRLWRAGAIQSLKDPHWDIRPCPGFGTLEVRICDGQANLRDTLALVALIQCLFAWLDHQPPLRPAHPWYLRENKWRAIRWGLDADMIVDEEGLVRPLRHELADLIGQLEPHAQQLGCAGHLRHVSHMVLGGNSAQRQRETFRLEPNLASMTQALVQEWRGEIVERLGTLPAAREVAVEEMAS